MRRQPGRLLPPADRHRHRDGRLPHRRPDRRARAGDGRDAVLQALQARRRHAARTWPRSTATAATACAPRSSSTTARNEAGGAAQAGRLRLEGDLRAAASAGSTAAASSPRSPTTTGELIIEGMKAAKAAGAVVSFDLNYRAKLWNIWGGAGAGAVDVLRRIVEQRRRAGRQRGGPAEGPRHPGPGGRGQVQARPERLLRHDRQGRREATRSVKVVATTLREVHSTNRHSWGAVAWIERQDLRRADLRARRARPRRRRRRLRRGLLLRPAGRRIRSRRRSSSAGRTARC